MELYQLKTFVVVAEEGNLTRAAARLHASQPAVSGHVKALEEELDVTLFVRTSRGMELTSAGEKLRRKALVVLDAAHDLENSAQDMRDELEGELSIGLNTDPDFLRVGDLVADMSEHHPKLRLHLSQSISGTILGDIKGRTLDAGFVFWENPYAEVVASPIHRTRISVVAPMAMAERACACSLAELAELPWIWPAHRCFYRQLLEAEFAAIGKQPKETIQADGEEVIRALVNLGKGMSLMRIDEARREEALGNLVICDLDFDLHVDLYYAYAKSRAKDPALRALFEAVKRVWGVDKAARQAA
ncbi:LysR family transcriptional regulator [Salidesulfovibrio onnuriiensis]|uniref:LysR family transcriptional regulator n=1 Tax=Salidesulfovibrio onnuriiensis TaxID=2583823 RepID=UPI0011CB9702|nr:LysR family transcriptional regulator [Salidesulfovibrio onnuriiensis]